MEDAARTRKRRRLAKLAWVLDAQIKLPVPGTRVGLDSLLGLVPGLGDAITAGLSCYIVIEAGRMGVPKRKLAAMVLRILLDFTAGSVPVAGDLFDVFYKANVRNLRSIGIVPHGGGEETGVSAETPAG